MKAKLVVLFVLVSLLPACVTYRDFPEEMVNRPPTSKPFNTLYYTIKPFGVLSTGNGNEALRDVFRHRSTFTTTEPVDAAPARGIYCDVEVLYKTPTLPAFAFGYLSASTLTLLPFWSQHDGYRVRYHLYFDGVKKKSYEYDVTRKGAVWILLLPFAWVNVFTYSEAEVFEATAYQFFKESQPLLAAYPGAK